MKKDIGWAKKDINWALYEFEKRAEEIRETNPISQFSKGVKFGWVDAELHLNHLINQLEEPAITTSQAYSKLAESFPMNAAQLQYHLEKLVEHGGYVTYGKSISDDQVIVGKEEYEMLLMVGGMVFESITESLADKLKSVDL